MIKRILFLCARRSIRAVMAASLLNSQAHGRWHIWIAPATFDVREIDLVQKVLAEAFVPLLLPDAVEPTPLLSWDEGIVLCSGSASQ